MSVETYIKYWAEHYKSDLTQDIMPFWLRHGWDRTHGGIHTCLTRQGEIMDTTKSVWFQGRFAYVCAYAYNHIAPEAEWLEASCSVIDFIERHCFDTDGRMFFEVMSDGTPLRKRRYVFSESFAAIAMAEYSKATGDAAYAQKALQLFKSMRHWLKTPGILPPKYLSTVQTQGHSITMIMINVASCIKQVISDPELDQQINESILTLQNYFMHPEYKALLETVGPQGEFIDTINGRLINPGHCIETAWFLMEVALNKEYDKQLIDTALTILDWSWDWGWDKTYGGIINFRDCKGYPCQDYAQDMKFWWPQTEAIIATLYAYKLTQDSKYLKRHREISDWTYSHFPDHAYGEWYGYLHRDGSVAQPAKGNIFKGPFHIPRMMIKGYTLCQEILNMKPETSDSGR